MRFFRSLSWDELERERLETAIQTFEQGLPDPVTEGWQGRAKRLAQSAQMYLGGKRWDAGWTVLMAAKREALGGLNAADLAREAERILAEGNEKLHGWRKEAVESHLKKGQGRDGQSPSIEALQAAQEILDEHFGNVHRRLRLLGRQVLLLSVFLVTSLGITLLVAFRNLAGGGAPEILKDEALLGSVMGLGVLGASVSSATGIVRSDARTRVPDVRWSLALMTIRPLIGAASAPLVIVLLQSGFGQTIEVQEAATYALAIMAGFTERIATSAVDRAVRVIEQ